MLADVPVVRGCLHVLVDCESMDGLALAQIVNKRWPDIRLLLTSGHHKISDEDMPDHGKFPSKSYSSSVVLKTIKTHLPDSD